MIRTNKPIRLAGYISMPRLLELNRDALRAMAKPERQMASKALIREIIKWSTFSNEEAIGLLQSAQFALMVKAEDDNEVQEERQPKKVARRIT